MQTDKRQTYFSNEELQVMKCLGGIGFLVASIFFPKHKLITGLISAGLGLATVKVKNGRF